MKNLLRDKLTSQKYLLGTHVSFGDLAVCDIFGRMGYDYLWIDLEHTALSNEQAQAHIMMTQARGTAAIVRVPPNDFVTLKRIMEMGPDGIVFPMVENAAHARKLLDYTLYPPIGNRGFGPRGAVGYGLEDTNAYLTGGSKELCRFVQIELRSAYEDLDAILQNPWVDGVIVGPCDLAGDFGDLTDVLRPEMLEIIRDIAQRAHAAGKRAGISFGDDSHETLKRWFDLGIDMVSAAGDVAVMVNGGLHTLAALKKAAEESK